MSSAFGWIADLVNWFARIIPRLYLLKYNYSAIKYVYGKKVKELKPGIHIYWPLVTEIEEFPIARQTQSLEHQVLMTSDMHKIVVTGVIIYEVSDVVAALSENYDINDTISDIAMTSIVNTIRSRTMSQLMIDLTSDVEVEFTNSCRDSLWSYGVKVHRAAFLSCSECLVIRNIGETVTLVNAEEDEYLE